MSFLTTLGSLSLSDSDFSRSKLLVLLAYLALEGPTPRRRLQVLFWGAEAGAGNSLRVGLHYIRQAHPDLILGEEILETRVDCDAVRLLSEKAISEDTLDRYAGPFLHGVKIKGCSEELSEWIDLTREQLALSAQRAGLRAAELAITPAAAARIAEKVYFLPGAAPLSPPDLHRLQPLSTPGSHLEGALLEELKDFEQEPEPERRPTQVNPVNGLLGRQYELGVLLGRLADSPTTEAPASRLTEVTGPGGVGKTTLVDAALREHAAVTGTLVASVDVEGHRTAASVASALAQTLGTELQDRGDTWQALGQALGGRPAALGFHGTEHLPELTAGVMTLLAQSPTIQVILTSRIRMTEGTHLRLGGLPLPPSGADAALLRASPTVEVFVRAARHVGVTLDPERDFTPLLGAVVRRLDGHPLALRLAGHWTRVWSLQQIHDQLLPRDLDLTPPTASEWSPLRAVFERSWLLLSPAEQRALRWLSVFADTTSQDALNVASVDARLLEQLENHSLLRRRGDRLQVFPVLAQQVTQDPDEPEAARTAHARHYLGQVRAGPVDPADLTNVHLAAHHALAEGMWDNNLNDALLSLHDLAGWLSPGYELFARLSEQAAEMDAPEAVRAGLLVSQAWLSLRATRATDAERLAGRAMMNLGTVEAHAALVLRMKALNVQAAALNALGQTVAALPLLRAAAALAAQTGDPVREARYLANLGILTADVGDFAQAEALLIRVVALHVAGGHTPYALLDRLQLLALRVDAELMDPRTLLPEASELVTRLQQLGAKQETCRAQMIEARLYLHQDPDKARRLAQNVREQCSVLGFTMFEAAAALVEAEALYALGHSPQARRAALRALDLCLLHQEVPGQFEVWLVVASDLAAAHTELYAAAMQTLATSALAIAVQRAKAMKRGAALAAGSQLSPERPEVLSERIRRVLRGGTAVQATGALRSPQARTAFKDR